MTTLRRHWMTSLAVLTAAFLTGWSWVIPVRAVVAAVLLYAGVVRGGLARELRPAR